MTVLNPDFTGVILKSGCWVFLLNTLIKLTAFLSCSATADIEKFKKSCLNIPTFFTFFVLKSVDLSYFRLHFPFNSVDLSYIGHNIPSYPVDLSYTAM